jgi:hypothetical protein
MPNRLLNVNSFGHQNLVANRLGVDHICSVVPLWQILRQTRVFTEVTRACSIRIEYERRRASVAPDLTAAVEERLT